MANTIDIMFEILDNISNKWKEEKIFFYGQCTDMYSDPTHAFEFTKEVFGIRAKSEEEGKILLAFQFIIMKGYKSTTRKCEEIIDYYYGDQTVEQIQDYILNNEPLYIIHTFNTKEKITFGVELSEGSEWIEKYYTGCSDDYVKLYLINVKKSEVKIWNMNRVKEELNNIRVSEGGIF